MEFWTLTHAKTLLPSLVVMITVAWLLRRLLADKTERVRMIPFQIVATLIVVLEIIKQVRSVTIGYDLYHLPFHVCSVITVLLPVMAYYRGRFRQGVRAVTVAFCAALFALMMIAPNAIYSDEAIQNALNDFGDLHTTVFHTLAIFAFVLAFALELYKPQPRRHVKGILIFSTAYCAIAAVLANALQTNFNNFKWCVFAPVEQLRLAWCAKFGDVVGQVMYDVPLSFLNIFGMLAAYMLYVCFTRVFLSKKK